MFKQLFPFLFSIMVSADISCNQPKFTLENPTWGAKSIRLTLWNWDQMLMDGLRASNFDVNSDPRGLPGYIGVEGLTIKVTGTGIQDTPGCQQGSGCSTYLECNKTKN